MKQKSSSKPQFRTSNIIIMLIVVVLFGYFLWMLKFFFQPVDQPPRVEPPKTTIIAAANLRTVPTIQPTIAIVSSQTNTDAVMTSMQTEPKAEYKQFPPPYMLESSNTEPSVLVVGGTDGSGTRRVVQILTQLGVTMVSEDPETYDIHADLVKGWPEIVRPVIKETHTLNYNPDNLACRSSEATSLQRLLGQVDRDSTKPESHTLAVGGVLKKPEGVVASKIKYGFKAPVAMTLSPWWAKLLPHFKLVHSLRDGRDIAFSANQGPVDKFYNDMYSGSSDNLQVKAIRLWSDWNTQVHTWANEHFNKLRNDGNSENSFGYLAIHSEDLVSLNPAVRFAAIYHLAKFVGSNLDDQAICCIAIRDAEFMGSHDRQQVSRADAESRLAAKYGKWKGKLNNNPQLKSSMYKAGGRGLEVFGYEPLRSLADESMATPDGFQCTEELEASCPANEADNRDSQLSVDFGKAEDWTIVGMCEVMAGVDYKGEDITAIQIPGNDKRFCCKMCKETKDCNFFTIDPRNSMCYLKYGNTHQVMKEGLISGSLFGN